MNKLTENLLELLAYLNASESARKNFYLILITKMVGSTILVIALGGNQAVFAVIYIISTAFIFGCCYEFLATVVGKAARNYLEHK